MSQRPTGVTSDYDPRSVSDQKLRAEHSRKQVERWRDQAQAQHRRWLDVMNNGYGKSR